MRKTRLSRPAPAGVLVLGLIGGCAEGTDEAPTTATEDFTLAAVEDETGDVTWLAPSYPGDLPEVVINVRGTFGPILHPDFVDRVGPVQAYLAVAPEDGELPDGLRSHASEGDLKVARDPAAIARLRDEARAKRDEVERANAEGSGQIVELASSGCTSGQQTAARNAYGAAYSAGGGSAGVRTCGNNMAFHNTTGTYYYCNFGGCDQGHQDCSSSIVGNVHCSLALGPCSGVVSNGCTTVAGQTRALRARFRTYPGAGAAYRHWGKRYRFAYYNCSDTYTAVMRRKRGNGSWITTQINPGWMQIRVGGGAFPAPHALAHTFGLGGSVWKEDHLWDHNTASSPFNQMEMLAQNDGFMCGDIIQRFHTVEASSGSCNGGQRLCDDSSCSGPGLCFD